MTTLSERIAQSAFDGSRLRVVLLLDLYDGCQKQFLDAYEHMRNHVASVPGHISDQLCQSIENPSQWLITSEWESAPPFLAWVNSEEHVRTVMPLHSCVRDTRSLRFSVLRETGQAFETGPEPGGGRQRQPRGGLQPFPRVGDGVVRHALTFTVKPGSEQAVAKILAGYSSPSARVDDQTRLRRTSLFMHGNRVVRAIEVQGDLMAALRHVARQPEVRAVEEAINPYLEQDRDLDDGNSARLFFTRAALPAVHHVSADGRGPDEVNRHALLYRAKKDCGLAVARLLSRQDELAADDPAGPVAGSTVFHRDDIVVRLIDVEGPLEDHPELALGVQGPRKAAVLGRLLADGAALGRGGRRDLARFVTGSDMQLITDRLAAPES
ncbi:SchA/CurD-like domain-containing protein [Streptomyces clavuligerus]|uniref:Putative WhiE I protein n=1 Tax=Streptomyces clavuligerus TaxID=1901 RepID=E2PVZ6_STRCL|nr:SchA/CurD-like domain-containing protein [Streptomyces clavuligerus]ANW17513.1 protein in whiE locus [Streptomyces clavuligerus]AXU12058.1 TcmI family type II polyketide cyclase [Streptomyces clavuligerus]EFG09986.1 putative WhiE I protein [Streptomyces clavuligerus]MBY6301919.1 antibiotic biosynthesis monooxygenase [Streptomyces clavuligerus]QCS04839.1 TcmI family type II polyketide cyclase [Streptomyces clavuligerus]